jgi:hypothetical protein
MVDKAITQEESMLPSYNKEDLAIPRKSRPVVRLPEKQALSSGCYLMAAGTKGGKTLTGYMLAKSVGGRFWAVNEPKGDFVPNREHILKILEEKLTFVSGAGKAPLLVMDSGNVYMFASGNLVEKAGAFKGGLTAGHVIGLLALNDLALRKEAVIVVTLNSMLFPVGDLEGAVEGSISITRPGSIISKSDRVQREAMRVVIATAPEVNAAARELGLKKQEDDAASFAANF